jgi:hypothetical protein
MRQVPVSTCETGPCLSDRPGREGASDRTAVRVGATWISDSFTVSELTLLKGQQGVGQSHHVIEKLDAMPEGAGGLARVCDAEVRVLRGPVRATRGRTASATSACGFHHTGTSYQ